MSTLDIFVDFDQQIAQALLNACRAMEVDIHDEGQTLPDWLASVDKTESSIFDADIEKWKSHQEQSFNTTRTVLHCLLASKPETTIEYNYPVAQEFEGIASIDCIEFCNSHGLLETLRQCLKHVRPIFQNRTRLFAELSFYQDDDTDDIGHIVIRLDVKSEREAVRTAKKVWIDWFIDNVGPEERSFFNLVVRRGK